MDYIEMYEAKRLRKRDRERSERTIEIYVAQLRRLETWLHETYGLKLDDKGTPKVKGYMLDAYDEQVLAEFASATRNLYITTIKLFFRHLYALDMIEKDPSEVLELVRKRENTEESRCCYTVEDIMLMMDKAAGPCRVRVRAAIALLSGTGMRASEVCRIKIGHIRHYATSKIHIVVKGGKEQHIVIADWAMPFIQEYLEQRGDADDDEPLFVSRRGEPLNRFTLYGPIATLQKSLGLPTGIHNFRHTCLTAVKAATGDIEAARAVAFHTDSAITDRYDHDSSELRRQALTKNGLAQAFNKK